MNKSVAVWVDAEVWSFPRAPDGGYFAVRNLRVLPAGMYSMPEESVGMLKSLLYIQAIGPFKHEFEAVRAARGRGADG